MRSPPLPPVYRLPMPFARSAETKRTQEHRLKPVPQKRAPRLIAAPLRNENRKRVRLLGLLGSFLVGLLGFLCHKNLLPSFSRLFGQGKLANCDPARCNSYTSAGRKCQENFAS